ncbi:uncharacterized protein LOC126370439 [Pectinophora gossypiella]|uniref:uncharacterized protein LOC126370439 n=1 Tax=Pectinophora gossypiella TaxID=13191 RepID=UPI00214E56E2|nr:uncharacterized protein LOC126370439 [Pectinophora gossypiella]
MARQVADSMFEGCKEAGGSVSSNTFTKESIDEKFFSSQTLRQSSSSSYLLADDHSALSRDIDRWMNGSVVVTTENAGIQSRIPMVQRSVLARSSSLDRSGLWYLLAMILPLFSMNSYPHWRCTPSVVLNTAELLLNQFSRICGRARQHIRQLARDQVARELFATAMDIVLVIYAIGFLILSMYQASIFG